MKSVENAGNIKENSDSILETLEYLAPFQIANATL